MAARLIERRSLTVNALAPEPLDVAGLATAMVVNSVDEKLTFYDLTALINRKVVTEDQAQTLTAKSVAVTASGGATRLLTAAGSGSVNLFDAASGITYTLPANPTVGLYYDFYVSVLQTASSNIVIANAVPAATYLIGSVVAFSGEQITPSATLGPYINNSPLASTFVQLKTNGTTTGGGVGSWFRFVCVSTTTWFVTGVNHSPSGSIATPFSV